MKINNHLSRIIEFFESQSKSSLPLRFFEIDESTDDFLKNMTIDIQLEKNKDIVLKEELGIELGGIEQTSYSLIYPTNEKLDDNRDFIYLLGEEINEIDSFSINFGLFILIQLDDLEDTLFDNLRHFSFISDSIEGFSTRSIPRRFWCRINDKAVKNGFSFEFLGKAIIYLYKKKYGEYINSIKIFMMNSDKKSLEDLLNLISDMKTKINKRWKNKIDNWKKRIDCDYSWACEICPFLKACKNIQQILEERKKIK